MSTVGAERSDAARQNEAGPAAQIAAAENSPLAVEKKRSAPGIVRHLEGLRGLAALVVAMQHIFWHTLVTAPLEGWRAVLRDTMCWLFQGRVAVNVFIVLSGYLLMRPVIRNGTGQLPGGVLSYLRRRALRILPPYYMALTLAIGLIVAFPALHQPISIEWSDALPAFGHHTILAHLLLIHNLSFNWASKIDPPMWTVATEWQIYFVFPILLLPVWRRAGNIGSVFVGLAVGLGGYLLTGKGHATAPWFLGLFAFGMAAASRERPGVNLDRDRHVHGWIAAILFGIFGLITALIVADKLRFITVEGLAGLWPYNWEFDILAGIASASLLVFCSASARGKMHWIVKLLASRWLVRVGVFSYSLYLIHDPLLALSKVAMDRENLGPYTQFLTMVFIVMPVILVITHGFHLVFEKPFMSSSRVKQAEHNANPAIPTISAAV